MSVVAMVGVEVSDGGRAVLLSCGCRIRTVAADPVVRGDAVPCHLCDPPRDAPRRDLA